MESLSEHEAVGRQPDPVRAKVDEWLAGIQATRDGVLSFYFIHHTETTGVFVTPDNADEVEAHIRDAFAGRYPDLVVIDSTAVEIAGDLTAGPSPESPEL